MAFLQLLYGSLIGYPVTVLQIERSFTHSCEHSKYIAVQEYQAFFHPTSERVHPWCAVRLLSYCSGKYLQRRPIPPLQLSHSTRYLLSLLCIRTFKLSTNTVASHPRLFICRQLRYSIKLPTRLASRAGFPSPSHGADIGRKEICAEGRAENLFSTTVGEIL